ncbi:MAG: cbb3-type cytochrome c oxidase subunit II [Gammaproteobacteria bacterium]|jgi:cytochrome c oxidase cbb3-type subunit II
MAFREYTIGARMFGLAFGSSMFITLYMPAMDIRNVSVTEIGLERQLGFGRVGGFSYEDPFLRGDAKPQTVEINTDPKTGATIESTRAYVYQPGVPFPNGIRHPVILGAKPTEKSLTLGKIEQADDTKGAVFIVREVDEGGESIPYIENATATRGWTPDAVMKVATDENTYHIGKGKIMFVREGCWWCHTLLPEETQDWQYFGAPPMLGDFNGESPTAFGSDRKAPDLTHVGSRNSSREWMIMHFFNPRLVQPHSIMPRYDYLWGEKDANGNPIDYDKWRAEYTQYAENEIVYPPEVPVPAADSEARALIDFVLNLK